MPCHSSIISLYTITLQVFYLFDVSRSMDEPIGWFKKKLKKEHAMDLYKNVSTGLKEYSEINEFNYKEFVRISFRGDDESRDLDIEDVVRKYGDSSRPRKRSCIIDSVCNLSNFMYGATNYNTAAMLVIFSDGKDNSTDSEKIKRQKDLQEKLGRHVACVNFCFGSLDLGPHCIHFNGFDIPTYDNDGPGKPINPPVTMASKVNDIISSLNLTNRIDKKITEVCFNEFRLKQKIPQDILKMSQEVAKIQRTGGKENDIGSSYAETDEISSAETDEICIARLLQDYSENKQNHPRKTANDFALDKIILCD